MFESSKFTSDFNQRNWEQILCNEENDVKFSMNKYLSKIDSLLDTHPKSHQKITYNKLSLITENPLPYQRLVWDFRKANHISIRKEIELIIYFPTKMYEKKSSSLAKHWWIHFPVTFQIEMWDLMAKIHQVWLKKWRIKLLKNNWLYKLYITIGGNLEKEKTEKRKIKHHNDFFKKLSDLLVHISLFQKHSLKIQISCLIWARTIVTFRQL